MLYPGDEKKAKHRMTSEEMRALDRLHNDIYNEARQAAEAHRQVFQFLMAYMKSYNNSYCNESWRHLPL